MEKASHNLLSVNINEDVDGEAIGPYRVSKMPDGTYRIFLMGPHGSPLTMRVEVEQTGKWGASCFIRSLKFE